MTKHEYSIGPTGPCIIVGSLELTVDEARKCLEELGENEKSRAEAKMAHIYANHGEGRRFIGYVKANGEFIDQRVS